MQVQVMIQSFKHVFEDNTEDVVQGESVFVETKEKVSFVQGYMSKYPKSVGLWVPEYDEETYDEVHALSIANFREEVCDPFQNILKLSSLALRKLECSVKILVDLGEAVMVNDGRFDSRICLLKHVKRWLHIRRGVLWESQAVTVTFMISVQTKQHHFPPEQHIILDGFIFYKDRFRFEMKSFGI